MVEVVKARAKGRCEIATWDHPGQDPHHVIPRSLGGDDTPANVIWICRFHHDLVDVPFGQGRLVIVAMGDGQRFKWEIVRKRDKWATDLVVLGEGVTRG